MFTKTIIALSTALVLATALGSAADAQTRLSRQQAGQVGYGAAQPCITNGDDSFLSALQGFQVC